MEFHLCKLKRPFLNNSMDFSVIILTSTSPYPSSESSENEVRLYSSPWFRSGGSPSQYPHRVILAVISFLQEYPITSFVSWDLFRDNCSVTDYWIWLSWSIIYYPNFCCLCWLSNYWFVWHVKLPILTTGISIYCLNYSCFLLFSYNVIVSFKLIITT